MNHHDDPTLLAQAIGKASDLVKAVSYEYPGTWEVMTKRNLYLLGDVNGYFAWHDEAGEQADSTAFKSARNIALAFAKWLDEVEAN